MARTKRCARRKNKKQADSKSSSNDEVTISTSNPFPICSVPSSIPGQYRNIIENLSNHVTTHRAISCSALSNIICADQRAATELINAGLIPVILPLILDADTDVALHAAGLLHNLAIMDGAGFAHVIHNLKVFDEIVMVVLRQSSPSWSIQMLSLLSCLTEYGLIIDSPSICHGQIWDLSSFISSGSNDLIVPVLEIFRNVIDDRPIMAQTLFSTRLDLLRPLLQSDSLFVKAHTTALLSTIACLVSAPALLPEIAPHLARCLSVDLAAAKRDLIAAARRSQAEINDEMERQRAAHSGDMMFQESIAGRLAPEAFDQSWQNLFQSFRDQTMAVQIAAETIANLICIDRDQEQILNLCRIHDLIPILRDRIRTIIDDDQIDRNDWSRVLDLIYGATERCIESMINLVLNQVVSGSDLFDLVMNVLYREATRSTAPRLWLLQILGQLLSLSLTATSSGPELSADQLQLISELTRQSASDGVRQEFVTVLARFATGNPARAEIVADTICHRLQDESDRVFLEAINALIDIFADDDVHEKTLTRLGLIPKLNEIAADDRRWDRCDQELMEEAAETRTNLCNFIQYRSTHP